MKLREGRGLAGLAYVLVTSSVILVTVTPAVAAPTPAPTVSSFAPTSGPLRTPVTITGTNITSPATVRFGGVAATAVKVNSSTSVTAVVPDSAPSGPIQVSTKGGTATSKARFTVTPGAVLSVPAGPPGSPLSGGFSGFAAYEAVDFYFDTTDVRLVSASSTGAAKATIAVPVSARPGVHYVTFVGRKSGLSAQVPFTVRTDWNQFGFDAAHTGANPYEHTLGASNVEQLALRWKKQTSEYESTSTPVVNGGLLITASNYNEPPAHTVAHSLGSGAQVWSADVDSLEGTVGTPAVSGSTLVDPFGFGAEVDGLDTRTGARKWYLPTEAEFSHGAVATVGGTAYLEVHGIARYAFQEFVAVDAATGKVKWTTDPIDDYYCSGPTVGAGILYATCENNRVYAYRASDGASLWNVAAGSYQLVSPPLPVDGQVIVGLENPGTGAGALVSYDGTSGDLNWLKPTGLRGQAATVSTADGRLYARGSDASGHPLVASFDAATGSRVWQAAGQPGDYSSTIANGLLYVPGEAVTSVLDAATGRLVTQLRGGQFALVTDAGVTLGGGSNTLSRYELPASASARRPSAAALRPNPAL